jgi:hypothetical protein
MKNEATIGQWRAAVARAFHAHQSRTSASRFLHVPSGKYCLGARVHAEGLQIRLSPCGTWHTIADDAAVFRDRAGYPVPIPAMPEPLRCE